MKLVPRWGRLEASSPRSFLGNAVNTTLRRFASLDECGHDALPIIDDETGRTIGRYCKICGIMRIGER